MGIEQPDSLIVPTTSPEVAAPAPTAETAPPVVFEQHPEKSKPKNVKKIVKLLGLVLVVALVGGGLYLFKQHQSKNSATVQSPKVVSTNLPYCYVRLAHLVCVNSRGANAIRYDLPLVNNEQITSLVASPSQNLFVAGTKTGFWLLDSKLGVVKQIIGNKGDTLYQPSWSHDDKSLFLELDAAGVANDKARQIYRYDVATAKFTQLTTDRLNRNPHQLKDGRIVYLSYSGATDAKGNSWVPYVVNADGSKPEPYAAALITKQFLAYDYDLVTDTVYLLSSSASADFNMGKITYFSAKDPTKIKVLNAAVSSSADSLGLIAQNTAIVASGLHATIIDLNTSQTLATVKPIDSLVGQLDVTNFTKSKDQTEQPHERIIGLSTTSSEFQKYIMSQFDKTEACSTKAEDEISFVINKFVRDSFADVEQYGCGSGVPVLYAKKDGVWVKVTASQMTTSCAVLNAYQFTKEIAPTCYDDSNKEIPNTNP